MVTARGIKACYESRVGRPAPDSTVCRLLARHQWRQVLPRPKHPKDNPPARAAFKKLQAKVDAVTVGHPHQPLRLMFEDEARFGRMSEVPMCRRDIELPAAERDAVMAHVFRQPRPVHAWVMARANDYHGHGAKADDCEWRACVDVIALQRACDGLEAVKFLMELPTNEELGI